MTSHRLLLDTHAFLWLLWDPAKISDSVKVRIAAGADTVVSVASLWEIAIKAAAGKWHASRSATELADLAVDHGCRFLDVMMKHVLATASLPPIHRDPFDRLLIAQAMIERRTLVTADRRLAAYDVTIEPC